MNYKTTHVVQVCAPQFTTVCTVCVCVWLINDVYSHTFYTCTQIEGKCRTIINEHSLKCSHYEHVSLCVVTVLCLSLCVWGREGRWGDAVIHWSGNAQVRIYLMKRRDPRLNVYKYSVNLWHEGTLLFTLLYGVITWLAYCKSVIISWLGKVLN